MTQATSTMTITTRGVMQRSLSVVAQLAWVREPLEDVAWEDWHFDWLVGVISPAAFASQASCPPRVQIPTAQVVQIFPQFSPRLQVTPLSDFL